MSSPVASENTPSLSSAMLRRTVAVVDMVGYSSIAKILEENISAASVADLNHQIQAFMTAALAQLPDPHRFSVVARTGDGIILLFEAAADAHLFGYHVHLLASRHNESRAEGTAMRRFRVGIATGEVSATAPSNSPAEYAGITIANAVRLEAAAHAGEIVMDAASFAALAPDLQSHYGPETSVKGKREESFRVRRFQVTEQPRLHAPSLHPRFTRRSVLISGAALAAGTALAGYLEGPSLRDWMWARSHPLPQKRFVALMGWLTPKDPQITRAVKVALAAIENELSRAEAADRSFFILPYSMSGDVDSFTQLNSIRDSLGANLVLAASGVLHANTLHLSLRLHGSPVTPSLRERVIRIPVDQQLTLGEKAVATAANLLNLAGFHPDQSRSTPGTSSPEAFAAYQAGEQYIRQENDDGLDQAITQYKQSIKFDARYAAAHAGLAFAYARLAVVRYDTGAPALAEANAQTALSLDPNSVVAHVTLAAIRVQQGQLDSALKQLKLAKDLDPADTQTLFLLAQTSARLNHWQEAEQVFNQVISLRPNSWIAYNELGKLLYDQGRYAAALRQFQTARLAAPKSTLPLNNVADINLQLGNLTDALSNAERSLSIKPTGLAAFVLAATLRTKSNLMDPRVRIRYLDDAYAKAQQATELDPGESLNWLELGDCCSLIPAKKTEAADAYRQARKVQQGHVELDPADGPGLMLLALFQIKCDPFTKVLPIIQKAEAMPAGDIDSQLYKARILEISHNRSLALDAVRQCLARGATRFQVEGMLDMSDLVQDPIYRSLPA